MAMLLALGFDEIMGNPLTTSRVGCYRDDAILTDDEKKALPKPFTATIKPKGKNKHLGVTVSDCEGVGVKIDAVDSNDLIANAGLTPGCVVIKVNGTAVLQHAELLKLLKLDDDKASAQIEYLGVAEARTAKEFADKKYGIGPPDPEMLRKYKITNRCFVAFAIVLGLVAVGTVVWRHFEDARLAQTLQTEKSFFDAMHRIGQAKSEL